jgi:hypothetical protein
MKKTIQKLKAMKGSILAYTLIVLFIILATAIGIASVSVLERKGASSTDASVQAFQTANSGVEEILAKIKNANSSATISSVFSGASCSSGKITQALNRGTYVASFIDASGAFIACDSTALISTIREVKSVGHFSGNTRAVQVAVAAFNDNNGNSCKWLQLGPEKSAQTIRDAVDTCRSESTGGSDWYLPTAEELACFIYINGASTSSSALLTRTPVGADDNRWVTIKLSNGDKSRVDTGSTASFRCVR